VDYEYQIDSSYKKGWNKARRQEEEEVNWQWWFQGTSKFSTLNKLKTMSQTSD